MIYQSKGVKKKDIDTTVAKINVKTVKAVDIIMP
jgi:hypothetical protein